MSNLSEDYGTCCICESDKDVRNIIQLDYKAVSESGWGCFVCGLPAEGAVAVVCDTCFNDGLDFNTDDILFLMDGMQGRIVVPPPEERIPYEHDMSKH